MHVYKHRFINESNRERLPGRLHFFLGFGTQGLLVCKVRTFVGSADTQPKTSARVYRIMVFTTIQTIAIGYCNTRYTQTHLKMCPSVLHHPARRRAHGHPYNPSRTLTNTHILSAQKARGDERLRRTMSHALCTQHKYTYME